MIFFATLVSSILSQFSQPSAPMFKIHLRPDQVQQAMAFFQSMVAIFMVGGQSLGIWVYEKFNIEARGGGRGVPVICRSADSAAESTEWSGSG